MMYAAVWWRWALLVLSVLVPGRGALAEPEWRPASLGERRAHSMVYDAARGELVVFGGVDPRGDNGETWVWDGDRWELRATTGPTPRWRAAMAFDAARGEVVLFGGFDATGRRGDTWVWNGRVWTERRVSGPSPRHRHRMVYDNVRQEIILFGGSTDFGAVDDRNGQTWSWNGSQWTLRSEEGPLPRRSHAMSYDPVRGEVVLHGGNGERDTPLKDTWVWRGSFWEWRSDDGPTWVAAHDMVYDPARGETILFGGANGPELLGDTWAWDGNFWVQRSDVGPSPRANHTLAFHPGRQRVVLFGGEAPIGGFDGETWTWDGVGWSMEPAFLEPPVYDTAMAHDSARGQTVLFGGVDSGGLNPSDDTWTWDGTAWHVLLNGGGPPARVWHAMAYDSVRHEVVLFGGGTLAGSAQDTWTWNGAAWSLRATTGPSPRSRHAMAFDIARGEIVLFGGSDDPDPDGFSAETWIWDGVAWQLRSTEGPSARLNHSMTYDSARGEVVLFGGIDDGGNLLGDTWVWNGSVWSLRATSGPSPRVWFGNGMAFDGRRGEAVLFGGADFNSSSETWTWDGADWTLRSTGSPPGSSLVALAYDDTRGEAVLLTTPSAPVRTWLWGEACAADLTGDGIADFGDVSAFVLAYQSADPLADRNGDGIVDFGDVAAFVDAFGFGC
jgi:hypothetical protein